MPFAFGNVRMMERGYQITDSCTAYGICKKCCTCNAIREGDIYLIDPVWCLHCGRCYEKCPENAIIPINIYPGSL